VNRVVGLNIKCSFECGAVEKLRYEGNRDRKDEESLGGAQGLGEDRRNVLNERRIETVLAMEHDI